MNIIIPTKVVEIWNEQLELNDWIELLKIIYTWCLAHRKLVNSQEVLLRGRVEPSPEVWPGEGLGFPGHFRKSRTSPENPAFSEGLHDLGDVLHLKNAADFSSKRWRGT